MSAEDLRRQILDYVYDHKSQVYVSWTELQTELRTNIMGELFYLMDKHMLERHDDPELVDSVKGVLFDVRITDTGIEDVERRRDAAAKAKKLGEGRDSKWDRGALIQPRVRFSVLKEFYEQKIMGRDVSVDVEKWATQWGVSKRDVEVALIYLVRKGAINGEFVASTDVPTVSDISDIGMEDYESQVRKELVKSVPGPSIGSKSDPNIVWVVYGRNESLRLALFEFLRAVGLTPMEFHEAIELTAKGAPYVGETLDAAIRKAQAVIVLLSPDDEACLKEEFRKSTEPIYEIQLTGQPRQNVLFEAGLAFGHDPAHTILVRVGDVRPFSDIYGRLEVQLTNDAAKRHELVDRLKNAGCNVKISGRTDWLKVGDFSVKLSTSPTPEETRKKLSMSEAETIAVAFVKKERKEADNIKIYSKELKDNHWVVSGSYPVNGPKSGGTAEFDLVINADTGEVVKSKFGGHFVGVG